MSGSLKDLRLPCRAESKNEPSLSECAYLWLRERPRYNKWGRVILFAIGILSAKVTVATQEPYIGYSDYQILTDRHFDTASYFQEMRQSGVNLQRIWAVGYGHTSPAVRENMPFARKGRKYDLEKFDPHYIARLKDVFRSAASQEQRVMFTLFDRWQIGQANRFVQTPWYYKNNTGRFLKNPFPDFYNVEKRPWMEIQENYVRTLVRETKEFEPIYEIMNEAKLPGDCKMLARWHAKVAAWIREEAPGSEIAVNTLDDCDALYELKEIDWISLHYGDWSSGVCAAIDSVRPYNKKVLIDTDGAFVERVDNERVRQWLKEALQCGASFNHKDDIYRLDSAVLEVFREAREKSPQ